MSLIPIYLLENNYRSSVYSSGNWVDGFQMQLLAEKLQEYLKVKHVLLTSSGTSSLLAAYWVLKKKYRQIDVDPYTFPATYNAAKVLGYKINYHRFLFTNNFHLNSQNLTVVTHLYGQPNRLLNNKKNPFIEDACQAFGSEINGIKVGTTGLFGCFSFYPTKSLHTCGHGGALATNDDELFEQASLFINSGRKNGFVTREVSLNLRMDEIKAEFLLRELKDYDKKIKVQIDIAKEYIKLIPLSAQKFLKHNPNDKHIFSVFNLMVNNRDQFQSFLQKKGISTMIYYNSDILPTSQKNIYQDITSSIIAIPCRWNLRDSEIKIIQKALKDWFHL